MQNLENNLKRVKNELKKKKQTKKNNRNISTNMKIRSNKKPLINNNSKSSGPESELKKHASNPALIDAINQLGLLDLNEKELKLVFENIKKSGENNKRKTELELGNNELEFLVKKLNNSENNSSIAKLLRTSKKIKNKINTKKLGYSNRRNGRLINVLLSEILHKPILGDERGDFIPKKKIHRILNFLDNQEKKYVLNLYKRYIKGSEEAGKQFFEIITAATFGEHINLNYNMESIPKSSELGLREQYILSH